MKLHTAVRLKHDLPDDGLRAGDVGAIVHIFHKPRRAYEVEFVDDRGRTRAQLTLLPHQVAAAAEPRIPATVTSPQ